MAKTRAGNTRRVKGKDTVMLFLTKEMKFYTS